MRVVDTLAEVEALPDGTRIRDDAGVEWTADDTYGAWLGPDDAEAFDWDIKLPAEVLE